MPLRPAARFAAPLAVTFALVLAAFGFGYGVLAQAADDAPASNAQSPTSRAAKIPMVEIPYSKFVLDNGLTLIVHEDHETPIVAVNMWYHVGSKDEGPDQHGFAHLFEHLMFQGSEHWDGEYFEPFERAGATDMNGTTNADRTNYFANVPVNALDMALWMESDRMGHFLGAISEARLLEQTEVVINEKKQRSNSPYGEVWELIPPNTYPEGHPYSWSTIGSIEDLKAATLEDVRDWFKTYYGPTNAVLVIAGDVDTATAKEKVEHYFGSIPAGPPLTQQDSWIAPMEGEHRQMMRDQVAQARIYKIWNIPPDGNPDNVRLQIAGALMAGSKTSPFYKRLVYDEQIATSVSASVWSKEIGSQFILTATARPGVPLDKVEAALDEELAQFLEQGPSEEALARVRTSLAAGFLRGAERIGGFGGKSDILAHGEIFHNNPHAYKNELQILRTATTEEIRASAEQWLTKGVYVLSVLPFGQHSTIDSEVDRSALPDMGPPPTLDLPEVQRLQLDNGLNVWLAERHGSPLVHFNMVFNAGYAADPPKAPGTASMVLSMIDEGAGDMDALEISAALNSLGAGVGTGSSLDASTISLSSLSTLLDESMAIYAEIIRNPTFPEHELERLKKQRLAHIAQEKTSPTGLALRTLGPLLYGEQHGYGVPLTGSGTREAVLEMSVQDLKAWYGNWIRPDNAHLVVVGDVDMAALKDLMKKHFGEWQAPTGPRPEKRLPTIPPRETQRIFLIDRPGSTQATVIAGNLAPPSSQPENIAMSMVNAILGGMFNSRLNLNLREDKHWSYGASSALMDARAQQPFFAFTSVQIDKTADAMAEIREEITGILGQHPPTAEELNVAQANATRSLPGENETIAELAGTFTESVVFDLPPDYYDHYVQVVRELDLETLNQAAPMLLDPNRLTWVVVGDLSVIAEPIRALDWGPVEVIEINRTPEHEL